MRCVFIGHPGASLLVVWAAGAAPDELATHITSFPLNYKENVFCSFFKRIRAQVRALTCFGHKLLSWNNTTRCLATELCYAEASKKFLFGVQMHSLFLPIVAVTFARKAKWRRDDEERFKRVIIFSYDLLASVMNDEILESRCSNLFVVGDRCNCVCGVAKMCYFFVLSSISRFVRTFHFWVVKIRRLWTRLRGRWFIWKTINSFDAVRRNTCGL